METIKSYTDLDQSRKLAEILPLESADMKWYFWKSEIDAPKTPTFGYSKSVAECYKDTEAVYLPCWSLAALLDILQKSAYSIDEDANVVLDSYKTVEWNLGINNSDLRSITEPNPIDACYEMILKLHELNLL